LRAQGHDAELPQDAASSRQTSTSPLGSCLYLTAPNSPAVSKMAKSPIYFKTLGGPLSDQVCRTALGRRTSAL
jgi:hypothetical protein